ncbi:MAG: Cna B-type domain-containing protein, partial [Clostridia bacterium]|nr:Cna B-type domain-containing protein [Clostridia bacterium]
SCVLSEATGWTYTIANLDKYANGAEIAYTITEEPVEHYDSVITGNAKDGYVVTNTYIFEIPEEPVPETSDRTLYGAIATAVATIALGVAVLLKRRSLLEDAE